MDEEGYRRGRRVSFRRGRITLDKDYPRRLEVLMAYFNSLYFFGNVQVYETTKGFRFRIQAENTVHQNLDVRRALGDDPNRLKFDEMRIVEPKLHHWIDTGFQVKWKDGAKIISKERECNPMSEAYITRLPAKKP